MANRYVWGRYNISPVFAFVPLMATGSEYINGDVYVVENTSQESIEPGENIRNPPWPKSAMFKEGHREGRLLGGIGRYNVAGGTYYTVYGSEDGYDDGSGVLYTQNGGQIWVSEGSSVGHDYEVYTAFPNGIRDAEPCGYEASKGTSAGTVSNASSGAYPADGTSGNYWYELQGNDNIDASAVGYNTQQPRGGQPITITVTPSAGNVYGGTVRYTYQVQLAGGAWQTISSNNTAASLQYTIPAGTATFAARVLASDTWGFSSTTYTTGATLTVINNNPPSAPDGINIGAVLGGEQCTITWGAATDADGTIASYQLERQIDNGDTWTQIYTGLALTYDDTINSEWATVNYRVRAVDDDGAAGPYTTGTVQTVNAGWLYFSGPPEDMGDKPAPFTFAFSIGSTTEGTTDISVAVLLDDENIYTGTPDAGEQVSLEIDTRLSYEGEHTIVVSFEKANLLGDQYIGTYNVPAIEIPDGGHAVQLYNSDGEPVFPNTIARQVFAQKGDSAAKIFDRYFSGTYTGTGTSGAVNPCSIRLSFVPRFLFVYSPNGNAWGFWIRTAEPTTAAQGTMATNGGSCTGQWDNATLIVSWYGSRGGVQLNTSGTVYGFVVTG